MIINYDTVKAEVKLHLSVIGKRLSTKDGKNLFSNITVSTLEDPVFVSYIKEAAQTILSVLSQFVVNYSEESYGAVFTLRPARNDSNFDTRCSKLASSYAVMYTLAEYLGMVHPELADKYTVNQQRALQALIGYAYFKLPPQYGSIVDPSGSSSSTDPTPSTVTPPVINAPSGVVSVYNGMSVIFTYTPDSEGVDNVSVTANGGSVSVTKDSTNHVITVSSVSVGSASVIVSYPATSNYAASSSAFVVQVTESEYTPASWDYNQQDINAPTVSFTATSLTLTANGSAHTFGYTETYNVTLNEYLDDIVVSSSNTDAVTVTKDASNNTITITPHTDGSAVVIVSSLHYGTLKTINVTVSASSTTEIWQAAQVALDGSPAYITLYTEDAESTSYDYTPATETVSGRVVDDVRATSSNSSVATVSVNTSTRKIVVTPVAAGSCSITISSNKNYALTGSSLVKSISLTVAASRQEDETWTVPVVRMAASVTLDLSDATAFGYTPSYNSITGQEIDDIVIRSSDSSVVRVLKHSEENFFYVEGVSAGSATITVTSVKYTELTGFSTMVVSEVVVGNYVAPNFSSNVPNNNIITLTGVNDTFSFSVTYNTDTDETMTITYPDSTKVEVSEHSGSTYTLRSIVNSDVTTSLIFTSNYGWSRTLTINVVQANITRQYEIYGNQACTVRPSGSLSSVWLKFNTTVPDGTYYSGGGSQDTERLVVSTAADYDDHDTFEYYSYGASFTYYGVYQNTITAGTVIELSASSAQTISSRATFSFGNAVVSGTAFTLNKTSTTISSDEDYDEDVEITYNDDSGLSVVSESPTVATASLTNVTSTGCTLRVTRRGVGSAIITITSAMTSRTVFVVVDSHGYVGLTISPSSVTFSSSQAVGSYIDVTLTYGSDNISSLSAGPSSDSYFTTQLISVDDTCCTLRITRQTNLAVNNESVIITSTLSSDVYEVPVTLVAASSSSTAFSLSANSASIGATSTSATIRITPNDDTNIVATSSNTSVVTASISNNVLTITRVTSYSSSATVTVSSTLNPNGTGIPVSVAARSSSSLPAWDGSSTGIFYLKDFESSGDGLCVENGRYLHNPVIEVYNNSGSLYVRAIADSDGYLYSYDESLQTCLAGSEYYQDGTHRSIHYYGAIKRQQTICQRAIISASVNYSATLNMSDTDTENISTVSSVPTAVAFMQSNSDDEPQQ